MFNYSTQRDRYLVMRNVTLVGVIINILLAIAKLIFGWIGRSQALIADGLHSLSDLISDGVVLIAAKYGSREADGEYPYGYARFETVATIIVSLLLMFVAIGICFDATKRLFEPELLFRPTAVSLAVVVVSILIKEVLYHYTMYIALQVRSKMLRANAWHHRSDAISSVIVLIGITGSMAGFTWLDAVASIGVGLMIAKIGWSLGWSGVRELVDTGLNEQELDTIKDIIKSVDGVRTLHELRTRYMGSNILVEVHILVNPRVSVSEGHQIGENVRFYLMEAMEDIVDVTVHIDPENDEEQEPNLNLPSRSEITRHLQQCWQSLEATHIIEHISLHYLSGKLIVEVYLPLDIVETLEEARTLSQQFKKRVIEEDSDIQNILVYFR